MSAAATHRAIDAVWRIESPRLIAGLARIVRDVGLAEDLVRQDRTINILNKEIFRMAVEIGDDLDTREWAMSMTMVARAFERIGDNAVDVGEQVAFIVTGLFREFGDAARSGIDE